MPRAGWKGFLRLSLVSCPVYLSPATTRTKSIRLHQVWVPSARPSRTAGDFAGRFRRRLCMIGRIVRPEEVANEPDARRQTG